MNTRSFRVAAAGALAVCFAVLIASCATSAVTPSVATIEATVTTDTTPAAAEAAATEAAEPAELSFPVRRTTFFPDARVDIVVEYNYVEVSGEAPLAVSEELTYDHSGELLSSVRFFRDGETTVRTAQYDAKGELKSEHLFQYDAEGRMLVDTAQDARGRVRSESRYAFDGLGRRTEWRLFSGRQVLLGISVYRYEGDHLAEAQNLDGAGVLQETVTYRRDGTGRLQTELVRDAAGNEQTRDDHTYDGDTLLSVAFFSAGVLVETKRYEYDADGRLVRIDSYGADDALKSYVMIEHKTAAEISSP